MKGWPVDLEDLPATGLRFAATVADRAAAPGAFGGFVHGGCGQQGIKAGRSAPDLAVTARRLCKFWSGYHRRSLMETKMHCFKCLSERVIAHTFERQVVELHVRVALLNRLSQIGRPQTIPMIKSVWGSGYVARYRSFAKKPQLYTSA